MSDTIKAVSSAAAAKGPAALLEGASSSRVDQRALERKQIEAQSGVARLEQSAKMMGFGVSTGGDDFIPRPGAEPPPASSTVVPPPAAAPSPGLQVGGIEGFPAGAVRTPGGFTVVATGDDARWNIYGPGQKPPEKPVTEVWGDPHVLEKDGTRWDFTKDSNFLLPDGTLIRCDTTSEVGHSVSKGISIVAGNDRVEVTGINSDKPQVAKTQDGEAWMQQNQATLQQGATFALRTDGDKQDWFRATNGKLEGIVTGSRDNFDGKNSYDQIIDGKAGVNVAAAGREFGGRGAGGLAVLGADVEAFLASVGTSLASLAEQDGLKDAFRAAAGANRAPVRRAPAAR
jgi:hypothetical protein